MLEKDSGQTRPKDTQDIHNKDEGKLRKRVVLAPSEHVLKSSGISVEQAIADFKAIKAKLEQEAREASDNR